MSLSFYPKDDHCMSRQIFFFSFWLFWDFLKPKPSSFLFFSSCKELLTWSKLLQYYSWIGFNYYLLYQFYPWKGIDKKLRDQNWKEENHYQIKQKTKLLKTIKCFAKEIFFNQATTTYFRFRNECLFPGFLCFFANEH